jgi:signal peptidase II
VCALVSDLATKALLWHPPERGVPDVVLIPRVLRIISHQGNRTAAMGLGPEAPWFYVVVALLGLVLISWLMLATPAARGKMHLGLGLLAGGAVGNLVDRVRLSMVRDFIDLHWDEVWHWPTFNVADIAICVGFALIVLDGLRAREEPGEGEQGEAQGAAEAAAGQ